MVHLIFDTDLSSSKPENIRQKVCVKSYKRTAFIKGEWVELVESEDNFQRHQIRNFKNVHADKLRLTIGDTQGAPTTRAYNE